jgi:hypothetical protein
VHFGHTSRKSDEPLAVMKGNMLEQKENTSLCSAGCVHNCGKRPNALAGAGLGFRVAKFL